MASKRFKLEELKDIELYPVGLSNEETSVYLKYEAEGKGSGSTHFSNVGEDLVRICKFDDNYSIEEKNGLLWLDVEGHATQALEGMMNSLHAFAIARVEVQLHTRNKDFVRDFKKVITYMNKGSPIPVFCPIHPSFFGDIVFVRASLLPLRDRLRSRILLFHMYLFNMILFLLLRKPHWKSEK